MKALLLPTLSPAALASLALLTSHAADQEPENAEHADPEPPPLKVLVYSDTAFYRHPEIPAINRWLVLLGHENGFEVDVTEHFKDLLRPSLERYDVLVLNNANELDKVLPETQRQAVENWFTEGGRGIVGLHAALVRQQGWPWLNQLGGCDFDSDSEFLRARVTVDPEAKDHPTLENLLDGDELWIEADWTNHDRSVTGLPGFQVLLRVDESTYEPVRPFFQERGGKAMGGDHPIAWTHEPESGGRFFYAEFGHDLRSLNTPFVRDFLLRGIRWAGALSLAERNEERTGTDADSGNSPSPRKNP